MPTGQLAANASDTLDTRQLLKILMAVKKGRFLAADAGRVYRRGRQDRRHP
jgi:hypothetical protein